MTRACVTTAFALSAVAVSPAPMSVRAGPDRIAFPENYTEGVLYTTVNRPVRPTSIAAVCVFRARQKVERQDDLGCLLPMPHVAGLQ